MPLDCYLQWDGGRSCGGGYWTWLFLQAMSEEYGPDFVRDYYAQHGANSSVALDAEIKERTGNASNLALRFADYARDVWDPTRWTTPAVAAIHSSYGPPAAYTFDRSTPDSGTQSASVDHLAIRYARIINDGGFQPTGPDDAWRISITRPSGLTADGDYLVDTSSQQRLTNANWPGPVVGSHTLTFAADPA